MHQRALPGSCDTRDDHQHPQRHVDVDGPLGAGKTTAVNTLLRREVEARRRVAVLINEFGAISVDGTLVDAERPELAGVENLVNGCVCCSLRNDVVATLQAWCDQPDGQRPERVVLETTGLADPTDLVDLEHDPALEGRLRLAGLLTVVSCLGPVDHLHGDTQSRDGISAALDGRCYDAVINTGGRIKPLLESGYLLALMALKSPTTGRSPISRQRSSSAAIWRNSAHSSLACTRRFPEIGDRPSDPRS